MKLIHITDTHFTIPGRKLYNLNPRARLDACISDINRHHSDADLCVITGDLTHWGEHEAYQNLKACLAELTVPLQLVVGNHDDRQALLRVFPETQVDEFGFIQSTLKTAVGLFIFLDTIEPGTHRGRFCERRQAWLKTQLDEAGDQAIYLFMHHPPFKIGLKALDVIALQDGAALGQLVRPYSNIKHLFFGHVHRPCFWQLAGYPVYHFARH